MSTRNPRNELLKQILPHCKSTRSSWRHPDYLRVPIREYREALVTWLEQNARETHRTSRGGRDRHGVALSAGRQDLQAHQRIMDGVMAESGGGDPMRMDAREFNRAAEQHYRETLAARQPARGVRAIATRTCERWRSASNPELGADGAACGEGARSGAISGQPGRPAAE